MISLTKDKELKGYKSLTVYPEVAHFVTTRHGGVSEGTYGSFNCSPYTKDSCINVNCNQNKLFQITGHQIKELVIPEQKHGSASLVVDESFFKESLEVRRTLLRGIDALITNVPGYCVCVTTADCVPVLLYDRRLQVVAAVHAGWRGTVLRIAGKTVRILMDEYGADPRLMKAGIAPSIGPEAFEVGEEVVDAFREAGFEMSCILKRDADTGKAHIDLWEANRLQLLTEGLSAGNIELAGICTYAHPDEFFSARRLGIKSGRILSGIFLRGSSLFIQ